MPQVRRCALGNTEAVGKCLRGDVHRVNRVAVSLHASCCRVSNTTTAFSRIAGIPCAGQGRSVLAQDMSRADSRVRYVYMRVTTCQGDCCDKYRYEPAHLSENVLFHLFPYFIGSFTPRATPTQADPRPLSSNHSSPASTASIPDRSSMNCARNRSAGRPGTTSCCICRSSYTQVAVMIAAPYRKACATAKATGAVVAPGKDSGRMWPHTGRIQHYG